MIRVKSSLPASLFSCKLIQLFKNNFFVNDGACFRYRIIPESYEQDQEFLKRAHHVLLEIEVINGDLVCPETSRKFPVSDGIPNMLLNEDEI